VFTDPRFAGTISGYLNLLIKPGETCWRYDEKGHAEKHKHPDWLWRIADRGKLSEAQFSADYSAIIEREKFCRSEARISDNYILFSSQPHESFVATCPPIVASAETGDHEIWFDDDLKRLTVDLGRG